MTRYEPILQVTEILKEKALETHRRNLEESQRLADELEQIDALFRAVQADQDSIGARQILGSDALYQGWLLRRRGEILRKAAKARANLHDSMEKARTAWSRAEAAAELDQKERSDRRDKLLARQADTLDELTRLRDFPFE